MPNEITVPCLPCRSIDEILKFYVALGFEITFQQTRPNAYGCVKHNDIELHFFAMKGFDPANSYSTCLVLVDDVNMMHEEFTTNLRQHYTKLPVVGIPRITKPSNKNASGDYRFNVIDPGGNWIRFIQKTRKEVESTTSDTSPTTKLSRAVLAAGLLVNAKGDFPAAAKILDAALTDGKPDDRNAVEYVQALVLRAEIAANMADSELVKTLITDIHQIPLTDAERMMLAEELQKLEGFY